jgi:hypothetical protein
VTVFPFKELNDQQYFDTQANTVYRLGNWEYSWQWRDAPESTQYATYKYGPWFLELQSHLEAKISGASKVIHLDIPTLFY